MHKLTEKTQSLQLQQLKAITIQRQKVWQAYRKELNRSEQLRLLSEHSTLSAQIMEFHRQMNEASEKRIKKWAAQDRKMDMYFEDRKKLDQWYFSHRNTLNGDINQLPTHQINHQ